MAQRGDEGADRRIGARVAGVAGVCGADDSDGGLRYTGGESVGS